MREIFTVVGCNLYTMILLGPPGCFVSKLFLTPFQCAAHASNPESHKLWKQQEKLIPARSRAFVNKGHALSCNCLPSKSCPRCKGNMGFTWQGLQGYVLSQWLQKFFILNCFSHERLLHQPYWRWRRHLNCSPIFAGVSWISKNWKAKQTLL